MKNKILLGFIAISLCSCSLLQRHDDETESTSSDEMSEVKQVSPMDSEISRLNTKISALETKLDVLSSNMERMTLKEAQPIIEAEPPQPTMAAPVEMMASEESQTQVSAAPMRPRELPNDVKEIPRNSSEVEKDFRNNMKLFQNGKNMEAATGFAMVAKKFPRHLLASHSLYWAGEAAARGQQWSVALESWSELEKLYPRSAYLPEALAGLARAYEKQGNISKAMAYRDSLMKAFPKSPVAMNFVSATSSPAARVMNNAPAEEAPVYEDESSSEAE